MNKTNNNLFIIAGLIITGNLALFGLFCKHSLRIGYKQPHSGFSAAVAGGFHSFDYGGGVGVALNGSGAGGQIDSD